MRLHGLTKDTIDDYRLTSTFQCQYYGMTANVSSLNSPL